MAAKCFSQQNSNLKRLMQMCNERKLFYQHLKTVRWGTLGGVRALALELLMSMAS